MGRKRKFSMTGLVLVICMIICVLLALAVVPGGFGSDKKKDLDDENTPGFKTVIEDGSPLFIFDKRAEVKRLIADFDDDAVQSVSATIGPGGKSLSLNVREQKEIEAIYKGLKNVIIGDELDESDKTGTDLSGLAAEACEISFVLEDGSACDFKFDNAAVYVYDKRYTAGGTEGLWNVIQELANE